MPTPVRAHRWLLGHVVLKIVKRKKNILVLSTNNLIIWFVLGESILQIQSNSWFTCAQLLAGGLWWFGNGLGFVIHVQNRMRKHPWNRLTLSLRLSCFHSHQCQQFHHVSYMDIPTYYAIGHCIEPHPCSQEAFPSAGSPFLPWSFVSRDPREPRLTFELTLSNITSTDRRTDCRIWRGETMCGKRCFILLIGSHGCQRHGWTLNPKSRLFQFTSNFEDRNVRWEIQGNPMPIEVETRRRIARERRETGSSVVSIETLYYKTIYQRYTIGRRDM